MSISGEEQTCSDWRQALDNVISTRKARDTEKPGTPTWDLAETAYQAALAAFRLIAAQIK